MFDVRDKAVIVTGGARGLGKEYARELLRVGAKVCIGDVLEPEGRVTEEELAKEHGGYDSVMFVRCDVASEEDWANMWNKAEEKFGYVSVIINNAGVNPKNGWRACIDVMVVGVMIGSTMAAERMSVRKGGRGGRIINTASIYSLVHTGPPQVAHYVAAKFATAAHSRTLGCSQGDLFQLDGIKCYSICPMLTDTRINGTPDEVAALAFTHKVRAMQPEEVGRALMTALRGDLNGACLLVYADCPLLEIPNLTGSFTWQAARLGQVLVRFGLLRPDSLLGANAICSIIATVIAVIVFSVAQLLLALTGCCII